jgi:hypothetical protein
MLSRCSQAALISPAERSEEALSASAQSSRRGDKGPRPKIAAITTARTQAPDEHHRLAPTRDPNAVAPREATAGERRAHAALFALLALTALAYLWNLGAFGDANSFYAAAVQAGTRSWKAFFFGSLDSSSFITTDKPPASIWVMARRGGASASAAGACSCRRRSRASRRSASSTPR